ncbi:MULTISPECIES: hypothetical protein [Bradyrhizobium]|nr:MULTISPECIES: hypothetical protein [Bradyrhizobium]
MAKREEESDAKEAKPPGRMKRGGSSKSTWTTYASLSKRCAAD